VTLSIIIVNYNVRAFLENCLRSLERALEGIDGEIIVVDNASDDGSVEMLKQKFPNVRVIVNDRNLGFSAANNLALKDVKGKYILLLNPDTVVQEDTLRVMCDFLDRDQSIGLAGCKILNPDGSLQLACRRSYPTPWVAFTKIIGLSTLFPMSRLFGRYNLAYLNPDACYEVDAVSGSFMFIRSTAIAEAGGLDEQFFMYGEDLDLCYRIKKAGWKVYYVHSTKVIHYKGESVRRSDINEVKVFYEAMRLFVRKHYRANILSTGILDIGITLRQWIASLARSSKTVFAVLIDILIVNIALLLGELIWFGEIFRLPAYAYPVTTTVPAFIIVLSMYFSGVYTTRKYSVLRATNAVIIGYLIISALTFFFKSYGFSRMVVVISGLINVIALPGWRVAGWMLWRLPEAGKRSIFGRRTLIVGVERDGQAVLHKLQARIGGGYEVVGFVDVDRKRIGERVKGVEILGSIDNIGKVVEEKRVSDVIFSTDSLSYGTILSIIARMSGQGVNFRLVPSSMEVIIGKTHIDVLDDIPLVEIDYNINRTRNKVIKRTFDILVSFVLLTITGPLSIIIGIGRKVRSDIIEWRKQMLRVFMGEMSIVGPPPDIVASTFLDGKKTDVYLGKPGITGLVQINRKAELTSEEIEKYNLYYAKNQSLILDIEILLKTFFGQKQREKKNG
jgi:GT2 family glycosyltransferase/lipopolysaccharide/colanic/teichoic acid biosynthesis glycosyltransferase